MLSGIRSSKCKILLSEQTAISNLQVTKNYLKNILKSFSLKLLLGSLDGFSVSWNFKSTEKYDNLIF
jgi:hypothetical protein